MFSNTDKIQNLNDLFESVRYDAYMRYTNFDIFLSKTNNYEVKLSSGIFNVGNDTFEILPVGTMTESNTETFLTFNSLHPSKLYCKKLLEILQTYNLPQKWSAPLSTIDHDGVTSHFKFGFMLSAVICNKLGALSFASVCPNKGTWVWFVVLKCINENTRLLLDFANIYIDSNTKEADKWYEYMKIDSLII